MVLLRKFELLQIAGYVMRTLDFRKCGWQIIENLDFQKVHLSCGVTTYYCGRLSERGNCLVAGQPNN